MYIFKCILYYPELNVLKHCIPAVSLVFFVVILFSCTIKQEARVFPDGSGSVDFRFEVKEYFVDSLMEMASFGDDSELLKNGTFFDIPKTKESFAEKPAVTLTSISSPEPTVLEGTFSFQDIRKVFEDEAELTEAGVLKFARNGGESTLTIHLDRKNFSRISSFSPALNNPLFEMFGPQENDETTRDEYYEMIEFAFGGESAAGLATSFVELQVTVEGELLSQKGGEQLEENTVLFRIPLVDILLLNRALDYSLTFK